MHSSPVEVATALDLDAGCVRVYYDYWELIGMYKLAETYMELGRDDFVSLIRIYKRFKHLGMKKHNMFKVLEFAKLNHLGRLQGKVESLENQILMLELKRTDSMNGIQNLNRIIEMQSSLAHRRRWYDDD